MLVRDELTIARLCVVIVSDLKASHRVVRDDAKQAEVAHLLKQCRVHNVDDDDDKGVTSAKKTKRDGTSQLMV